MFQSVFLNFYPRKWRLFGNETQEKDFIVTGGLLWWRDHIVMGCYNLAALHDEIRIYPRTEKLDNSFAKIIPLKFFGKSNKHVVLLINKLFLIGLCWREKNPKFNKHAAQVKGTPE